MKKKLLGVVLSLGIALSMPMTSMTALADTIKGDEGWKVEFTEDEKMDSNFKSSKMDDKISGMQPGDDAVFTVALSNSNDTTTDWYMSNKVLKSLEDDSKNKNTSGGAYTYYLEYTSPTGEKSVLFDSNKIGGDKNAKDAGVGLHQATDSLSDYFYLDTLEKGKGGYVTLRVKLDGETQGNDYQDTLAQLQMNFAVMMRANGEYWDEGGNKKPPRVVVTGDDTQIKPAVIIAGVAALVIAGLAISGLIIRKKEQKGGSVA